MGLFGKVVHLSFDAILVSTLLAGVRRSTGLTLRTNTIENQDAKGMVQRYLDMGEWVFDASASIMSSSGYFDRKLR